MFLLTLLFFRLADGLSTSRVDPSISISIHTEFKSFLRIWFLFFSVIYFSFLTHFRVPMLQASPPRLWRGAPCCFWRGSASRPGSGCTWRSQLLLDTGCSWYEIHSRGCVWWSDVACDVTAMSLSPDCLWTLCPIRVAQCHLSAIPGQPAQQLFI